jgi:hypothetical protein
MMTCHPCTKNFSSNLSTMHQKLLQVLSSCCIYTPSFDSVAAFERSNLWQAIDIQVKLKKLLNRGRKDP